MKKLLFAVLVFVSIPLFADEIYLLDGSVLKGKINQMDVKNVEFTSDATNETTTYENDKIYKVVYDNGEAIILNDKKGKKYPKEKKQKVESVDESGNAGNESFFLGCDLGWNGFSGLGVRGEIPLGRFLSINAGAGVGSWGWRLSGSGRLYMGNGPYGFALGFGVAYNTGLKNYETSMKTEFGQTETITFNFKPSVSYIGTLSYSWKTGSANKFYVEVGYAIPRKKDNYTYTSTSGYKLNSSSKSTVGYLEQKGIVIAVGFLF